MPKSGPGRPISRPRNRSRRPSGHVPGVPGFPVRVTFALREPIRIPIILAGALAGAALAYPVQRSLGWAFAAAIATTASVTGLGIALLTRRERCVEPGCGSIIRAGSGACPGCGGTIIGHLEAGGTPEEE